MTTMTIAPILLDETTQLSQASPVSHRSRPLLEASAELLGLCERWRRLAKDCEATSVNALFGDSPSSSAK